MTISWLPALKPRDIGIHYRPRNRSGGAATNGMEQVVSSGSGIWAVEFARIRIASAAVAQRWNGLAVQIEGRLNPVLVPFCLGPRPYASGAYEAPPSLPHSDDTFFSDDTGYTQGAIAAVAAAAVAIGATSMSIDRLYAGALAVGQFFSRGERAYQISGIVSVVGSVTNITFRPTAREAMAEDDALNFDMPVCRMRLESDDEMATVFELHRRAEPTVRFVEDLT